MGASVDFKENNAFDIVQGFSVDGKGVQSKEMMAKAMKEAGYFIRELP